MEGWREREGEGTCSGEGGAAGGNAGRDGGGAGGECEGGEWRVSMVRGGGVRLLELQGVTLAVVPGGLGPPPLSV